MDHKNLEAWKSAMELVTQIYQTTQSFPREELFGLTSQLRRSAISIPSNIAEGAGRNSDKEFIRFLKVALGSLAELDTQVQIARRVNFLHDSRQLENQIIQVRRLVLGLLRYLHSKKN